MRRLILSAFLLCAACGGGVKSANPGTASPDPSAAGQRAERTAVALSAAGQALVAADEKAFGQDAVESCLQQWIEDDGSPDPGLAYKPDIAFFRAFLAGCLGAAPGGVDGGGGLRGSVGGGQ
jgi:hypothetical protein